MERYMAVCAAQCAGRHRVVAPSRAARQPAGLLRANRDIPPPRPRCPKYHRLRRRGKDDPERLWLLVEGSDEDRPGVAKALTAATTVRRSNRSP